MKKLKITGPVFTIILISIISITFHVYGGELSPELLERLQTIQHKEYISVIVRMTEQSNLSFANQGVVGRRKSLQSMNVIRALKATAATAQKNINRFLEKEKEKGNVEHYTSFWIFNGLFLSATPQVIKKIAMRDDIETITDDLPIAPPVLFSSPPLQSDPLYTWNIKRIKAPEVWNKGYDGKGIVVGIFDSGVDYTHPDLKDRYRGGNNSWFDPHGEHNLPYDSAGHGTMITGIILGGNAHGKNIGVAPGAKWIAAKFSNDAGEATESDGHKIFQWFMDPDGNPETDDAPDVVNCSWGQTWFHLITFCSPSYREDIKAWRMAGIIPVFAAGNLGYYFPFFSGSSPATYPETISVGVTDFLDVIYFLSSRGPSNCDLSIFPDVVAPGASIFTSCPDGGYVFAGAGTSLAAPHVAGVVALMLDANPDLTVDEIESVLKKTAKPLGLFHPNNTYGWGRVDALRAVEAVIP